jgi:DNA-binding response OmpR family regulator
MFSSDLSLRISIEYLISRILFVDDEPDLTQVSTLALEYHGFKVNSFNDPQEALSKYKPGL